MLLYTQMDGIGVMNIWRSYLPSELKGAKPIQKKLPGMEYSTVFQVTITKGSRLLKELVQNCPQQT